MSTYEVKRIQISPLPPMAGRGKIGEAAAYRNDMDYVVHPCVDTSGSLCPRIVRNNKHKTMNNIIVVLNRPRDPRNIGAVIRAMLNTGFQHLRLVDPAPFTAETIATVAHRPEPILSTMTIFADLADALADTRHIVGTSDRPHPGLPWRCDIRQWAGEMQRLAAATGPIALLFGSEGNGLNRNELSICQEIIGLPLAPDYPTLNLAQSVLLILYELRQATPPPVLPLPRTEHPATFAARDRLAAACDALIDVTNFIKSGNGQALRRRLRAIIARTRLSERDAAILTALLRETLHRLGRER